MKILFLLLNALYIGTLLEVEVINAGDIVVEIETQMNPGHHWRHFVDLLQTRVNIFARYTKEVFRIEL